MFAKILVLGLFLCPWTEGAIVCSVTCEEGEYCFQDECRSCPEGSYLDEPIHQNTKCIPWTTKPSEDFYIARNGSSTSDVLWECLNGYVQYNADKCISITRLPLNNMTTVSARTFLSNLTTTTVTSNNSEGNGNEKQLIIILVVVLSFAVIIFIIVLIIFKKKRKFCFSTNRNDEFLHNKKLLLALPDEKCLHNNTSSQQVALLSDTSNKIPEDINFRFFLKIIQKLTVKEAEKFLRILDDPSHTFEPDNFLSFKRAEYNDNQISLTYTCLDWAAKNPNISDHKECVQKALVYIGRPNILKEIQESLKCEQDTCFSVNVPEKSNSAKDSFNTSNDEGFESSKINGREFHSIRFKFFYFLASKLDTDVSKALMYELPNTDKLFNAKNFFEQKLRIGNDFESSLVHTLEEWYHRNPHCVMTDCVSRILSELDRNVVLQVEEFLTETVPHRETRHPKYKT